ncbi:MAG: hypothetical protein Q9218_004814 [Villophora microphyllina]
MSFAPSAGGQPPSFKTNVNRAKTKRWVEAKSYSYDGDDWGDMDEYDEYGGYDEPAPPPRPTGLRQQGQSANREQQGMYQPQQPGYDNPTPTQHGYPNMGSQGPIQQPHGVRSVTNPPYQTSRMARPGSFDQGDERRAFSAANPHQGGVYPGSTDTPHDYPNDSTVHQNYQNQQGPPDMQQSYPMEMNEPQSAPERHHRPPMDNRPPPVFDQPQRTSMGSRTQSMTSNTPSIDFHNRCDFSPSAMPPPLHTRGSPSPQNRSDPHSAWRPPRKSSLGQQNQPDRVYDSHGPAPPTESEFEERELVNRERADSDTSKPLPFVRPADIYRRMQEEKERQRQSQDSSRSSMDANTGDARSEDETMGHSGRPSEHSQDSVPERRSRSTLDPVAERRSEYGMSGLPQYDRDPRGETAEHRTLDTKKMNEPVEARKVSQSLSPQLPDVARMSGFGELFSSSSLRPEGMINSSIAQQGTSAPDHPAQPSDKQPDGTLQHQPSLGLRSVVHQAFDATNDQIPETPSSSTADSSIGRSASGGTSVVSPIISRGPSSATANLHSRGPQWRPTTPPADERDGIQGRPVSSGSMGTPKAISRKLSPDPADQRPGSFIPGHRRDLSTPSPDNSPARTPALEANKQLQQPQEAEVAMTTPIETRFPRSYEHSGQAIGRTSPTKPFRTGTADLPTPRAARGGITTADTAGSFQSAPTEAPKSPAESTRSRVRNLADKFESGRSSPAGSERAPSPVKTNFGLGSASQQPRPLAADRMESFRPKLPGGWESSVSLAPLEAPSRTEAISGPVPLEQRMQDTTTIHPSQPNPASRTADNLTQAPRENESRPFQTEEEPPISDPFASLTAAGNALAGAFSSVMGSDNSEEDKDRSVNEPRDAGQRLAPENKQESSTVARPRGAFENTAFMPEASKPTVLDTPDEATSSIMPTPLDKLSNPAQRDERKATDYFAGGVAPKQQWSGDSYMTEKTTSTEPSQLTPALSIDTGPQYESDRLRREIIRELSPRMASESSTANGNSPARGGPSTQSNSTVTRHPHESMVIPREYDSYWNGSGSERSSRASSVRSSGKATHDIVGKHDERENTVLPSKDMPGTSPLSSGEALTIHQTPLERPDLPPHRFSFEGPIEPMSQGPEPHHDAPEPVIQPTSRSSSPVSQPIGPSLLPHSPVNDRSIHSQHEHSPSAGTSTPLTVPINPSSAMKGPRGNDLAGILRDLPPSAAEDDSNLGQGQPASEARNDMLPQLSTTDSNLPPPSAQLDAPPKIQSFREVLALKDPRDRIKGYNDSREHFANVETGLAHWLAVTTANLPEHRDILPGGRLPGTAVHKPSPARSKLGGLLSSGNSSAPPAGVSEGASPNRGNSTVGYSPSTSTGKLSGQQMQARGKDLLHSAGVFGGKANVAAKGLFSKGKSKFKGGNADKAPISSFNTNYNRDAQPQAQPLESLPNAPESASILERPHSSKRSISSRPTSFVTPPEHQAPETSHQGTHREPQPPPLNPPTLPGNDGSVTAPSSNPSLTELSSLLLLPRPEAMKAAPRQAVSPAEHAREVGPEAPPPTSGWVAQEAPPFDQAREIQAAEPSASSNRTPTQADYADYFRRGSSPTVQIPEAKRAETSQGGLNGGNLTQQTVTPHDTIEPPSAPALRSKYSTHRSEEVHPTNTNHPGSNRDQPLTDPATTNWESEDLEGTFHTAGSAVDRNWDAAGVGQSLPDHSGEESVEPSEDESSSSVSINATTPIAVPAANIQDQPKGRPFSFIQFSQNTTPKPLEDYSHRRPSVDSMPSQLDPEQDAPPSPVSSRRSVVHEPMQQQISGRTAHGPNYGLSPSTERRVSGSPPRSYARPSQGSAPRDERNATAEEDIPTQHYPAPIPRAEAVNPRQQATEYALEGVGPPPVPRTTNSTSNSKRGSRSSAFFRSFISPTETTAPAMPSEKDGPNHDDRQSEPTMRKTKSKRDSLFRSLTKGSKASSSEDAVQRSQESPQSISVQSNPAPAMEVESRDEGPTSMPSKYRNRLSRPATARDAEQKSKEPGKKKRFSAIGSLFGRSKDQGRASVQSALPQQIPESAQPQDTRPQDHNKRSSSSTRPTTQNIPKQDKPYQSTRDSLVKQGLLPNTSRHSSSKPMEPSAYTQDSAQRQRASQLRNQSLSHGDRQTEQRPSQPSQPQPSSSFKPRQQPLSLPENQQRHTIQSSITTRSSGRPSAPPQPNQNPRVLSYSTTTTTTTNGRMPHTTTSTRQKSSNNNTYSRSDSPPPPPPPPKDTWRQPKPQQRSSTTTTNPGASNMESSISNPSPAQRTNDSTVQFDFQQRSSYNDRSPAPVARNTIDPPLRTMNYWKPEPKSSNVGNPPQQESYTSSFPPVQVQPRQPLPPLQTNMPSPAITPSQPHTKNNSAGSDPEARKLRRSQIESGSATTPKAEQTRSLPATGLREGSKGNVGRKDMGNDDEPVVMTATSFPGQEWQPMGYGGWDEY